MTEIASYVFREENLEFAVHGSKAKFPLIKLKLELLLNSIKNNNSRYQEVHSDIEMADPSAQSYHQNFFKMPLSVNNCVETIQIPTIMNEEEYGVSLVLSELLTFQYLLPSIREKGGAYGAGCKTNESGLLNMYSFRDPKLQPTYDNFEHAIQQAVDGHFGDREMQESKLLAFQKLDQVLEPSLKGLLEFSRGYKDEHRLNLRLRALNCSKKDIQIFADKYLVSAIEKGETSRVVFGTQSLGIDELTADGWSVHNPMDFLSNTYFERWNENK